MIISVMSGDRGTVYDSSGRVVKRCTWANTNTGWCEVFAVDRKGIFMLDDTKLSIARKMVKHKPPLKFSENSP